MIRTNDPILCFDLMIRSYDPKEVKNQTKNFSKCLLLTAIFALICIVNCDLSLTLKNNCHNIMLTGISYREYGEYRR